MKNNDLSSRRAGGILISGKPMGIDSMGGPRGKRDYHNGNHHYDHDSSSFMGSQYHMHGDSYIKVPSNASATPIEDSKASIASSIKALYMLEYK